MTIISQTDDAMIAYLPGGRLTLTSGEPEGVTDVTNGTTLYYEPYIHDLIPIYNTTLLIWELFRFTPLSIAVPSSTNTNYDINVYNNAGTLTLEAVAWADDTSRDVALSRQNGVFVRSTNLGARYLGTIRTTATTGGCDDNPAQRFVYNYYNKINKRLYKAFADATWTYATLNTWRQCNSSTANQLAILNGVQEDVVNVWYMLTWNKNSATHFGFLGVGNSSTTANSGSSNRGDGSTSTLENGRLAQFVTFTANGYRYYPAIEAVGATGSGTSIFKRDSNTYSIGSMNGWWRC